MSQDPNFEEERLRILERVARQEISPQAGGLEIAMLKQRIGRASTPPRDASSDRADTVSINKGAAIRNVRAALRTGLGCFTSLALVLFPVTFCFVWLWNQLIPVYWPQAPALDFVGTWLLTTALTAVSVLLVVVAFMRILMRLLTPPFKR